ncbi:unnamed protein product [Caenorhabditis auriculariae]|uniref:Uncharacterized protein n=1 Tax=Caenorhabditis auriculariae TaxID=2777116 RepID=A0A8S1GR95_9PELO|nr:unnamed protein product [Caenorhabditis auriculariae]
MFKGLKSKLEDEAKKLQASVQQYSEQVVAQVGQYRGAMSDAGSEAGASVSQQSPGVSAIMPEVAEADLLGLGVGAEPRARRHSEDSNHSNESAFSSAFPPLTNAFGNNLERIPSDTESTCSEFSARSPQDLSSSSSQQLQKRLSNYKAKYRDVVKRHNAIVEENERFKSMLSKAQDDMLQRVQKLRDEKKVLSEKLRQVSEKQEDGPEIEQLKQKIEEYKGYLEKYRLKIKQMNEKQPSEDQNEVVQELNERIAKTEEEWTKRMNETESQHALLLAKTNAEMHAALENKDGEIEQWRKKCSVLEKQDGEANTRWQQKVDQLQAVVKALESEKNEMVDKLSEAKQQGVKAVLEEEEKRRLELEARIASLEESSAESLKLSEQQNEELKRKLEEAQQSLKKFQESNEVEELKKKLELAEQKNEDPKVEELQKLLQELKEANLELEAFKSDAQKVLLATREQCQLARDKYEQTASDMEQVSTAEFVLKEEETVTNERLAQAQSSFDARLSEFESEIGRLKSESEGLAVILEEERAKFSDLTRERDAMQEELEKGKELATRYDQLREELQEAKRMRDEVEQRLSDVTNQAERLRNELDEDRKKHEEEKLQSQDEVSEVSTSETRSDAVELLEGLTIELTNVREEKEALQRQLLEERERARLVSQQNSEISLQSEELPSAELAQKLAQLERETQQLIEQITVSKKEKSDFDEKERSLNEKIQELKNEVETKQQEILKIEENAVSSIQHARTVAEEQINVLNVRIEELTGSLAEKKTEKKNKLKEELEKNATVIGGEG